MRAGFDFVAAKIVRGGSGQRTTTSDISSLEVSHDMLRLRVAEAAEKLANPRNQDRESASNTCRWQMAGLSSWACRPQRC